MDPVTSYVSTAVQDLATFNPPAPQFIDGTGITTECGKLQYRIDEFGGTSGIYKWLEVGVEDPDAFPLLGLEFNAGTNDFTLDFNAVELVTYTPDSTKTYKINAFFETLESNAAEVATYQAYLCNCDLTTWSQPVTPATLTLALDATNTVTAALPTADQTNADPNFQTCVAEGACPTTGEWTALTLEDGSPLPAWVSFNTDTGVLTANPTAAQGAVGGTTYEFRGTYVPVFGTLAGTGIVASISVTS